MHYYADPNFKYIDKMLILVMMSIKAHEVMSVDIEMATENASLVEVATRIILEVLNGMPVIDKNGLPIGQITAIDILKAVQNRKDINNTLVKEVMSPYPITVEENTSIDEIITLMDKYGVMMVPVVQKDGRLIGICSRSDILREILNERFVTMGRKRTVTTTLGEK